MPPARAAYTGHIDVLTEATVAITRKAFLVQLVGGGWVLTGCGGGGYSAPAAAPGSVVCAATIAGNHNHLLTIPAADLNSTQQMSYDITYLADHSHTVTFTAAQLAQLKAGTMVQVTSTATTVASATQPPHSHAISEVCA